MIIGQGFKTLLIIIIICIYHFAIQNGLEKSFSEAYFEYNTVRRPAHRCIKNDKNLRGLNCIGMPSGHAEVITIFTVLLYIYGFIPLYISVLSIILVSYQRIYTNMHTVGQVVSGSMIGLLYVLIYQYISRLISPQADSGLSLYSLIPAVLIGLLLALLVVFKIDQQISNHIPKWISSEIIDSISKKQNVPLYTKLCSIYTNSIIQYKTFLN